MVQFCESCEDFREVWDLYLDNRENEAIDHKRVWAYAWCSRRCPFNKDKPIAELINGKHSGLGLSYR